MNLKSLFKVQTVVVMFVFSFACQLALAQNNNNNNNSSGNAEAEIVKCYREAAGDASKIAACKEIQKMVGIQNDSRCDRVQHNFQRAESKFRSNCRGDSCINRVKACIADEVRGGGDLLGANSLMCGDVDTSGCHERNAGKTKDFERDKKSALERRKDAEEKVSELQTEQNEATAKFKEDLQKAQQEAEDGALSMEEQQQKINKAIKAATAELDAQKTKAVQDATKQLNEMDARFIQYTDELNSAQANVQRLRLKKVTTCKNDAEAQYRGAKDALDKRIAAESAVRRNGNQVSLAGSRRRVDRKQKQELALAYAGYYKDCMNGSGKGAQADEAISNAEIDLKLKETTIKKLVDQMDKLRNQLIAELQKLESQVSQQKQDLINEAQEQLQNLQKRYVLAQQRQQQNYQNLVQNNQNTMSTLQGKMMRAGQEQQEASQEYYMASSRVTCAMSNGGGGSEASGERKLKNYDDALGSLQELVSMCDDNVSCLAGNRSPSSESTSSSTFANRCEKYKKYGRDVEGGDDDEDEEPAPRRAPTAPAAAPSTGNRQ